MNERHMIKYIWGALAVISLASQSAFAEQLPSKLTGVIIFSCVTMQRGSKIDEQTYKVDFSRSQVNNAPVDIRVDDLSIKWEPKKSISKNKGEPLNFDNWIWHSIDRFSGKLDREVSGSGLTFCRVAGRRKF